MALDLLQWQLCACEALCGHRSGTQSATCRGYVQLLCWVGSQLVY